MDLHTIVHRMTWHLQALSNRAWSEAVARMLKPAGSLLSNDRLTWVAAGSLSLAG